MQRKWARSALIVALTSAVVFPIGSTNAVERTGRVLSYRCELIATTLGEQITWPCGSGRTLLTGPGASACFTRENASY